MPTAKEVVDQYGKAKADRLNWESSWQEIAELVWPNYDTTFFTDGYHQTKGSKHTQRQFDSHATISLQRFAAAMESMLTPRNARWHNLRASDTSLMKQLPVRDWFDRATDQLFKYRYTASANFASQVHAHYSSLGAFGTAAMFIDRMEPRGIRYTEIHLAQMFFFENHQGIVDKAIRRFRLTARQAMGNPIFVDKLPKEVVEAATKEPEKLFFFLHWVGPNPEHNPDNLLSFPFLSYYVSETQTVLLLEEGYKSMPYAISRYDTAPGEIYGRSPAMDTLPNIKVLNEQKRTVLKQGHRIVDPVLLAHDDGVIDSQGIRPGTVIAGGISAEGREMVKPLATGNLAVADSMMEMERRAIDAAFLSDLFQILQDRPQMTATEVLELTREKNVLLSPTMGRQQNEFLEPLIDRELDLLIQQQLLDEMPNALVEAAGEYTIEFDSPLSRAQKAEQAKGLMQLVDFSAEVAAKTQDPGPVQHYNWDVIIPELAQTMAIPSRWMNSPEEVAEIREAISQQAQTQQLIDAGPTLASLAKG